MEPGYIGRVWSRFQSFVFVAFCAVGISYFLTHMSVVGVSQAVGQVAQQASTAEKTAGMAIDTANQAKAQSSQADATAQEAQKAAHRKFMAEKPTAKFMDLENRVRSLERTCATQADEIKGLQGK